MQEEILKEKFSEFFSEFYKDEVLTASSEGKKSMNVDFSQLEKFDTELADFLLENPLEVIPIAEGALAQIDAGLADLKIRIRFYNLPEIREIRIRNIRSEHIGKMIVVDGLVKRASDIRPEISEAIFECLECESKITIIQTERIIRAPFVCDSCDNRKGFKLVSQKLYDARWAVIEEPFEIVTGERPSEIRVYLKEDLTSPKMQNKTDPGNRIKVVGILNKLEKRLKGTQSRQMEIYIDVNFVESVETEWEDLDITVEDEQRIMGLAKDPEVYNKLIASVGPALYGLEEIKEAIALQLFGGEQHIQADRSKVRGDIHILLVGDPSTAKSAIMKVTSMLIPRARYVSGKGVSQAGLTASVIKDEEFLGGWVLEAGALVLANKSLIAIDEFEKIEKTDLVALHEAMELQQISIAKANIVATLPARTSVLGGGNPKFGRFDPYLPIKEQLDVPETLLTRFDLKFALRDIPNPEVDAKVTEHILRARHFAVEEVRPAIETEFLRKYVAYARKNCRPMLTKEAGEELTRFYLSLREKSGEGSPISITPRQYEALIRLAEASARVQLRSEVTSEDAMRGINLMKASLRQFGFEPETGKIDIDRAEGAKATSAQRNKIRIILDAIDELIATHGKEIPTAELIKRAKDRGVDNPDEIIRKMQLEGVLFSPRVDFLSKA